MKERVACMKAEADKRARETLGEKEVNPSGGRPLWAHMPCSGILPFSVACFCARTYLKKKKKKGRKWPGDKVRKTLLEMNTDNETRWREAEQNKTL